MLREEWVANPSEMPGAAAVAPVTLAAYQAGAVVSRILLKRGGGPVTLFAFDAGQSPREHTARRSRGRPDHFDGAPIVTLTARRGPFDSSPVRFSVA